ncbi:MAG: hypothetical protein M9953_03235 [Thermomicrobiales bacterium]|nr:hypothetical protein [Thermomicrobiales bacterium]MCO5218654.1 hypothetical protein [Thermomicrobiales bacterium]MCO5224331.1 hypothetical protein [Thermomicrobiales bacterium]MCO5229069.1 hypothetical protein [Thermomicrobiales bacterium]
MFRSENIIGILLLVFCAVVAVILVMAIVTGERPTVPPVARIPVAIIGGGAMAYLIWQQISRWLKRR